MAIRFTDLWNNHPVVLTGDSHPCKDKNGNNSFENECAICMGTAITGAGQALTGYHGAFCWHGHGRRHPLRVEEVIKWLNGPHASFVDKAEITKRTKTAKINAASFDGKRGIIACRNFWGRSNQGDHVDLWNINEMAHGERDYIARSEEVWFWTMT